MRHNHPPPNDRPPSLDSLLRHPLAAVLIESYGRPATLSALRDALSPPGTGPLPPRILALAADHLRRLFAPAQRPVFNLTGTVLHTNLGRAPLPPEAAAAAAAALQSPTSLEFDLQTGRRGDRDAPIRALLQRLTGAPSATVVNNNAAAVLLILNTLADRRDVLVSRGELIEIGGSFRIPDVISRAGARLVEVGTTNRTHARDYQVTDSTAAILRVHQANYRIEGFTAAVPTAGLAAIAHAAGIPLVDDLGSGSLVDLARWGLPHETTPQESLAAGADLVCFSADKLLGGPQAGLIVGRADLIARLDANPLKRALRLDKSRLAALECVLRLYLDPDRLATTLPALRLLTRTAADILGTVDRSLPALAAFAPRHSADRAACRSQIGSGALPVDLLESWAIRLTGPGLDRLAESLRARPRPVLGRIGDGALWLDCRCLEAAEEQAFAANLR